MPRPHKCRFVVGMPAVSRFKPAGVPGRKLSRGELQLAELEALRLADLEGFYQEQAAGAMGISRATFGRVLDRAHQKVADAIINGKMLLVQGGNVAAPVIRRFNCGSCGDDFAIPTGGGRPGQCPRCQSPDIHRAFEPGGCGAGFGRGRRCRRHGRGAGPG
jgi:predicted DNA-binding protein (UPF0251 family)